VHKQALYVVAFIALCTAAPVAALQSTLSLAGQCEPGAFDAELAGVNSLRAAAEGALDIRSLMVLGTMELPRVRALLCVLKGPNGSLPPARQFSI